MADERDRTASERGQVPAENAHAAGGREGSADALEQLSTRELHDRAVRRAERHLDVRFFWSLLQMIPAAEAASGDQGEAAYDVQHAKGVILDVLRSGDGQLAEALRPLFLDYLRKHPDA